MSPRIARIVLALSAVAAAAIVAVALWWPRTEPRADLEATAPLVETTTTESTTSTTVPVPVTTTTTVPTMVPDRLRIPAIGVDAAVRGVGLNPDGSMEIPPATEAGWYELGVEPGSAEGSSVVAAHVDYNGQRGAFFDLRSLPEGAEVLLGSSTGSELRYRVTARWQVDKDELPVDDLFRQSGPATLTLITCGGAFDRSARSYQDNIVVQAEPIA